MDNAAGNAYARQFYNQSGLYEDYARRHGLTGKAMDVLLWLYHTPRVYGTDGVGQDVLVARTHSTKQVVHAIVKKWQQEGLVTLEVSATDRRRKIVRLTTEGQRFAADLLEPLAAIEERAMMTLTTEERVVFADLYGRYTEQLTKEMRGK